MHTIMIVLIYVSIGFSFSTLLWLETLHRGSSEVKYTAMDLLVTVTVTLLWPLFLTWWLIEKIK